MSFHLLKNEIGIAFTLVCFPNDLLVCHLTFTPSTPPLIEPTSPSVDSEVTMEVDTCDGNSDGGHSMDEQDEASTPEEKIFFMEGEKDEEGPTTVR